MLFRGLTGSVLVLAGGLVGCVLPASTPVLNVSALVTLRDHDAGRWLGLAVAVVGIGLLAHAWLALCAEVTDATERPDSTPEDRAEALTLVRAATVVWVAPLLVAPPLFSRDGWSYAAQGMLVHLGISPYDHGPGALSGPVTEAVDPIWMHTPTPYGPLPLAFGDLFSAVTGNPWALVIGHRVVALAGLALLAWAVPRLAGWTGVNPAYAAAVVLASPLMMTNGVAGLHNDLLMVGLMAAALVVASERGWLWGAVLGGLAASVKAPGGVICLGVVLVSLPVAAAMGERLRRIAAVGLVSLAVLLGLGTLLGTGSGWVHGLTVPGVAETQLSLSTSAGRITDWLLALVGVGADDTFRDLFRSVATVVNVGLLAWLALRWPTGRRTAALAGVTVAVATLVLCSPVVHYWYLLWLTPFLATLKLPRIAVTTLVGSSVLVGLCSTLETPINSEHFGGWFCKALLLVVGVTVLLTRPTRSAGRTQSQLVGRTTPATSPSVIRVPSSPGAE